MATDADETTTEFVFEPRIRSFHRRAFFEPFGFMRGELNLLAPARIVVDDRDVPVLGTLGTADWSVVAGLHYSIGTEQA